MRSHRKGQFISMMAVFTLLMVSGGSLFTAVMAEQQISETVTYSSNDVNQLLVAKTRSEIYQHNIRKELNYTFNNVAMEIAEEGGGDLNWDQNIPSESQVQSEFESQLLNHEYNIKDQNRVYGCSTPTIDQSVLNIPSNDTLELDFIDPEISCTAEGTTAFIGVPDEYEVTNPNNNYLEIALYTPTLAEKVREIAPDSLEGTGSDSTDSCENPDPSDARDDAKDEAKQDAVGGHQSVAQNAYDQTSDQRQSFISADTSTSYDGTYEQTDSSTSECHYSCNCPPPGEEGSCDTCDGTEYSYEYEYTADTLDAEYDLRDSENQVITHSGDETIEFEFTYTHELQ